MKKIVLSIALMAPVALFGQVDRSVMPEAGPAPTINIEDSEVFTTENGITVILSENHKIPKVTFNLVMGATPMVEGSTAGVSEITGELITSGTTTRSKDQIDGEVDLIGANLNAGSRSVYMSCLTKHMDKALELMSDITMNANFPQSEVDRIITRTESSLMTVKTDEGAISSNMRAMANFPKNHPYGEFMTEESLANIDRSAIEAYYKEVFTPDGSYLTIVGDINMEEAKAAVEKYFAAWSGKPVMKNELVPATNVNGNRVIFVGKPGSDQSVISITFPMNITPANEDYIKLKVLNGVLGGGAFGNRLMQNLREDKAYTYGCRSSINVNNYGSTFTAYGNFRNEVTDSAIVEILYEINRLSDDYVTDEELNLTKASMAGSFARSLENPATVARFALSIIRNELPKDYYQTYLQQLDAVTKEDLLMVAQKYFSSAYNIIVVGNEEVIPVIEKFDADGKIEVYDAFGEEVVERAPADITADELLQRHISHVTLGASEKKVAKALKKIKTMTVVSEMSLPQLPQPGKVTEVWAADGREGSKTEVMGMEFEKSYFDGTQGGVKNMQTGNRELTAEEISSKKKSEGLIPEMGYAANGMSYELLGIEEFEGTPCYVLKTDDGENVSLVYYDKESYQKVGALITSEAGGESNTFTVIYSDFKEYNGIVFNDKTVIMAGSVTITRTVTERLFNEDIDLDSFK